jgi:hypothetical protein
MIRSVRVLKLYRDPPDDRELFALLPSRPEHQIVVLAIGNGRRRRSDVCWSSHWALPLCRTQEFQDTVRKRRCPRAATGKSKDYKIVLVLFMKLETTQSVFEPQRSSGWPISFRYSERG